MTWPIDANAWIDGFRFANPRIPAADGARQLATVQAIVQRLGNQPGLILADEVGMGKTFVALGVGLVAALADKERRPVVVMVPSALSAKWPRDYQVFRELVVQDTKDPNLNFGVADSALDLHRLLDDADKRLIFLKHGAFHVQRVDAWTRLALIQRAVQGIHLGKERRDALPRWAADLIRNKSRYGDEELYRRLLKAPSIKWKAIVNDFVGETSDAALKDDPVPKAVQDVLDSPELDIAALSEALRELPARASANIDERLRDLRQTINAELREIWPETLRRARFKSPLLILDEAHHLKNPDTRLASLFVDKEHAEEVGVVDGALEGTFERMLLLTATPFQLGHHELLDVLSRFRGIDWSGFAPGAKEQYLADMKQLQGQLDGAQRLANDLDRHWKSLRAEDLASLEPEEWWRRVRSGELEVPERIKNVLGVYSSTLAQMRAAQGGLSRWVVRHLRDRQLPETDTVRRLRRVGAAIDPAVSADYRQGLPVSGEALLPFLLAARAQAAVARVKGTSTRALFAEGLASSYEAFRETRGGSTAIDERPADESTAITVDSRVDRYLAHLDEALPGDAQSGRHPKVAAVVQRVVDLWKLGEKVVVFCHFRKTGNALVRHISRAVESALWDIATTRSGMSEQDARNAVARIGSAFDEELALAKALDAEILRMASAYKGLRGADVQRIQNIVRRFLRTPTFVARYFDLLNPKGEAALQAALDTADGSGRRLSEKLDAFLRFVESRSVDPKGGTAGERDAYLDALSRIMPGLRGERPQDDATDSSGGQLQPTVRLANGETDPPVRQRLMLSFNTPFFPEILVASSVLAEGVDLHLNCRYLIHHDLDWNPSTIEQRTGRVDRLGSKAENVKRSIEVFMPFIAATQDEKQFRVVTDRERWFQVLMGEEYRTDEASTDSAAERVPLPEAAAEELRYDLAVYKADGSEGSNERTPLNSRSDTPVR